LCSSSCSNTKIDLENLSKRQKPDIPANPPAKKARLTWEENKNSIINTKSILTMMRVFPISPRNFDPIIKTPLTMKKAAATALPLQ